MQDNKTSNYLVSVLTNKCPRCRQGYLFKSKNPYDLKHIVDMNEECPVCKQPTEIEVGFYYGTSYVSYALTVAFCVSMFVAWAVLFKLSFNDDSIFWCMGTTILGLILLQPVFMRLSRSIWLSWFVKYDANWKNNEMKTFERVVK